MMRKRNAYRVKMVEKRLWPSIIWYLLIALVVSVTVWQITPNSNHLSTLSVYTLHTSNHTYIPPLETLSPNDYNHLIDLPDFSFPILNLPCNESQPLLLVLIHSHPKNFETRTTLRTTWARSSPQVKILFVTGLVLDEVLKEKVRRENEKFGDLIQGSFLDAYRNMTYKHVTVFKYVVYHCPQAKYVLKTDDDVFVNMPAMLRFLEELSPFGGSRMLFCSLRKNSMVLRSWRSKWRVSFKEYPAKTYPPYCPGWAILYSPDVVFELYQMAQRTAYFWIDDVHVTGTLVAKINVTHVNVDNLVLTRRAMLAAMSPDVPFNRTFLFGAPNAKEGEIMMLWDRVKKKGAQGPPMLRFLER